MAIWLVTVILLIAMLLLITEKLPVDLTSIGIMVALILTGILTPKEAIAGFASPAVISRIHVPHQQGHGPHRCGRVYQPKSTSIFPGAAEAGCCFDPCHCRTGIGFHQQYPGGRPFYPDYIKSKL